MNQKIYIETYGCQMNVADSETVMAILKSKDFFAEQNIENADVIILNTCSVRENAEQRIWNRLDFLKGLKKRNKKIKIGIIGCMAQRISEKLLEHEAVDFVAGPDSYRFLVDLINEADLHTKVSNTNFDINETYSGIESIKENKNKISCFVSITRGCNNFCTYCIVPYTRGRERSRSLEDILHEINILKSLNYKEITLLGQNVNSYLYSTSNQDINFPKLICKVAETLPDLRIRFTTSHPKDISNDLIYAIAETPNICNHIHLPVQSGSNKILDLMNRKYTHELYLERIEKIKTIIPNCGLSTDMFCGFSNESEQDFLESLNLLKTVEFDSAFLFKYSVREGTYAAKNFIDDVPEELKMERLNEMIKLQTSISLKKNTEKIGENFDVLVEGFSKRSENDMFGRTEHNNVVVFPKNNCKIGTIVKTKIIEATSATLLGKVVIDK
ncbi:MAG: tRNA (N6-isopentenyl adenosine(37)-C2)-methylthiotransferase MiaB [Bacteroidales bacterium]|jgi:tRNA-2-methylthio-N6-dimethylallyladenosine synthase|nr:tRNA (N6-isopentenyl adenosine(37)-C2)-methylthiotransferase MiaB [Bacteroidales bacterium]